MRELGAPTQQRGLPPFRQLLLQDVCFNVQNALESEAWIELLPDRLLQAAAGSRTSTNHAISTPPATRSAHSSNIHAAIHTIYSPTGPTLRVLHAAALFLAEQPPAYRANCARVAAAVDAAVGSPAKLGLALKFKQIIEADAHACFKITPSPHKSEQYVQLDVQKLLLLLLHTMRKAAKQAPARPSAAATPAGVSSSYAAIAGSSSIAAAATGSSTALNGWRNTSMMPEPYRPGLTLLPTAMPPPPPAAPKAAAAAAAAAYAAVLQAFQAAALELMPPAAAGSSSDRHGHYPDDVIFMPDDDEQLFDAAQAAPAAAAAAAAGGELHGVQDKLVCSKNAQMDALQWPALAQQVLAQW
ncbi:hypothetical protein COO60DRAFT_1658044 [Scenedesmus sp. NREL 46B-D3]|nr:hypothetical protein COO60DRAFT_1658044 [Scenedesmus sp. NREL 46B-D3]